MTFVPQPVEALDWNAAGMSDASAWRIELSGSDHEELDHAAMIAKASGKGVTEITRAEFPLENLAGKLAQLETELLEGRGFALLSKLNIDRYTPEEATLMFWGIGLYLGVPRPQNKYGELIGDVIDRGTNEAHADMRDDERGAIALGYHTDGADLAALLCLGKGKSGGTSRLANVLAIYNDLCRNRPDVMRALHQRMPVDCRGEQPSGGKPFYFAPVFTRYHGRLFVRFLGEYIKTSQQHAEAPRLTPLALEAVEMLSQMAADPAYNVYMDLEPGQIQFINNYRVLHGRDAYVDAPELGSIRHMKRLWLETQRIVERPSVFRRGAFAHWEFSPVSREACL